MKFKEYLIERTMTFDNALKVFGISAEDVADKDLLKKKYRNLAMKHHPDKGGDVEKAQDVNDAYAVLSKSSEKAVKIKTQQEKWKETDEKYRMAGAQIKTSLLSNFHPEVFQSYFKEMSGFDFLYEIKRVYPSEKEKSPNYAGFYVEFFTKDRSTVFTFEIHTDLHDIVWNKNELGHGDLQYNVFTEAHGFHLNKKQKMSKSDWKWTRDHSFFRKPEQLFPKKRMKDIFSGKTSKRTFKKRDMIEFLNKKLGAKIEYSGSQPQAAIPLGENEDGMPYTLIIYRTTFSRIGVWMFNGVYLKKGKFGYGSRVGQVPIATLPEEEETAKTFEKIQKEVMKVKGEAKVKKTADLIKYAYEAYRKSKGI